MRAEQVSIQPPSRETTGTHSRAPQIALHVASSYGGAQFYLSCAQLNVVNGGDGTPGPLVSIPGVYTGVRGLSCGRRAFADRFPVQYEPGILINIYDLPSNFTGYQARKCRVSGNAMGHSQQTIAGPAVWQG